jgi:hypothetical protein
MSTIGGTTLATLLAQPNRYIYFLLSSSIVMSFLLGAKEEFACGHSFDGIGLMLHALS